MRLTEKPVRDLASWKEIADYLGVNVRTAQKWEQERGLPVRRLSGPRGRVTTSTAKLDAWKAASFAKPRPWSDVRLLQGYGAVTTAVILLLLTLWGTPLGTKRVGMPAGFDCSGRQLIAIDHDGSELWRFSFPDALRCEVYSGTYTNEVFWLTDLNGDKLTEALVAYYPKNLMTAGSALYFLDSMGKLVWRFEPGAPASVGTHRLDPPYDVRNFAVFDSATGEKRIAVASVHHLDHWTQVALLDSTGRLVGEYWHDGRLGPMVVADIDGDGEKEVLVSGTNARRSQATLVALAPDRLTRAPRRDGIVELKETALAQAGERLIAFFPRSRVNEQREQYNAVKDIRIYENSVEVQVQETRMQSPFGYVNYVLDRRFNLQRVHAWDTLANRFEELDTLRGVPFEDELERLRQGVEIVWTGHVENAAVREN